MTFLLTVASWVALTATATASRQEPTEEPTIKLPPELNRVLRDFEKCWKARDAEGVANLYTEDGLLMMSGMPPVRGREAVKLKLAPMVGGELALRAFAYATDGKVGFILGGISSKAGAPDAGKFTLTLKRQADGKWLIHSDMDNMNTRRSAG